MDDTGDHLGERKENMNLFIGRLGDLYHNNATRLGEQSTSFFLPTLRLKTVWHPEARHRFIRILLATLRR
jgi:hypothetical protein